MTNLWSGFRPLLDSSILLWIEEMFFFLWGVNRSQSQCTITVSRISLDFSFLGFLRISGVSSDFSFLGFLRISPRDFSAMISESSLERFSPPLMSCKIRTEPWNAFHCNFIWKKISSWADNKDTKDSTNTLVLCSLTLTIIYGKGISSLSTSLFLWIALQ